MPGLIGIGEFIDETREDYSSPTTSTFVSRMPQCRQTINALEEVSKILTFLSCSFNIYIVIFSVYNFKEKVQSVSKKIFEFYKFLRIVIVGKI